MYQAKEDRGSGVVFSIKGTFNELPTVQDAPITTTDDQSAMRIVGDEQFMVGRSTRKFNLWTLLEEMGGGHVDQIPHFMLGSNTTFKYSEASYGKPTAVGSFESRGQRDKEPEHTIISRVYWYGPIFLIVGESQHVGSIGGWPSRIGQQKPHPMAGLSDYQWNIPAGENRLRVHNPGVDGVTIGLRSRDPLGYALGRDWYVGPANCSCCSVPSGKFEVFCKYDNRPAQSFQTEPFELQEKESGYSLYGPSMTQRALADLFLFADHPDKYSVVQRLATEKDADATTPHSHDLETSQ